LTRCGLRGGLTGPARSGAADASAERSATQRQALAPARRVIPDDLLAKVAQVSSPIAMTRADDARRYGRELHSPNMATREEESEMIHEVADEVGE